VRPATKLVGQLPHLEEYDISIASAAGFLVCREPDKPLKLTETALPTFKQAATDAMHGTGWCLYIVSALARLDMVEEWPVGRCSSLETSVTLVEEGARVGVGNSSSIEATKRG